jgi:hypothetical protein
MTFATSNPIGTTAPVAMSTRRVMVATIRWPSGIRSV